MFINSCGENQQHDHKDSRGGSENKTSTKRGKNKVEDIQMNECTRRFVGKQNGMKAFFEKVGGFPDFCVRNSCMQPYDVMKGRSTMFSLSFKLLQATLTGYDDGQIDVNIGGHGNVQRDVDKVLERDQLRFDGQRDVDGDLHQNDAIVDDGVGGHLLALDRFAQ